MSRAFALLLVLASPVSERPPRLDDTPVSVSVFESDGQAMCNLHTESASLQRVLAELSENGRLHVEGLDPAWERMRITADLRNRPLRQALTFVLGSIGLRADLRGDLLVVRSEAEALHNAEEIQASALAGYMGVLRDFPDHPAAPEAELRQAEIEDSRGNTDAARLHFAAVAENYPTSPLAVESLLQAGESAMRARDWRSAATSLLSFTRKPASLELQVRGRLALARSLAMLQEHERAVYTLDALDALEPAATSRHRAERLRVRARALAGLGRGDEALELLDQIELDAGTADDKVEMLELHALANEAAHLPAAAARAWVAYAEKAEGADRERALGAAATRALAAGDELGALFVDRLARSRGVDSAELTRARQAARRTLALEPENAASTPYEQRIELAEDSLADGDGHAALQVLRALLASRTELSPELRSRFDQAHVNALADQIGTDVAIERVRACLATETEENARRRLYLLAGELFERDQRLDDAIEAYQGRL